MDPYRLVTYAITGTMRGDLWWPRVPAEKPVSLTFERIPPDPPPTLRGLLERLLTQEDGDFSSQARMLADSVLTIRRVRYTAAGTRIVRERTVPLAYLPSVADAYSDEWPYGEED